MDTGEMLTDLLLRKESNAGQHLGFGDILAAKYQYQLCLGQGLLYRQNFKRPQTKSSDNILCANVFFSSFIIVCFVMDVA